jgi:cell division protein FtsL
MALPARKQKSGDRFGRGASMLLVPNAVEEFAVSIESSSGHWVHRHLLVLRFALVNIVAVGLVSAIYLQGWLDDAFTSYTGWLTVGICAVFAFGMLLCARRIWRTNHELNAINERNPANLSRVGNYLANIANRSAESRLISANLLRARLGTQIAIVRQIADSLVFFGLVGTVIGFIVALSGVDPQASTQVDEVASMVATLVAGMSIALYTTLVGAVLHVWLMINHRLLATATSDLFNNIVELGEQRVGV